jgi:hypothetical protein
MIGREKWSTKNKKFYALHWKPKRRKVLDIIEN